MRPRACRISLDWLALAAVLLLAGCARGEPPLPSPVRLAADPQLADRALAVAAELLSMHGLAVQAVPDPAAANLVVTSVAPAGEAPAFVTRYWVPVVALSNPVPGLTMARLGDVLSGRVTSWSDVGGDPVPLRVLLPLDPSPPLDQWWPGVAPFAERAATVDIAAVLASDPGALALLPLEAVDARAQSLAIDGADIVFGSGGTAYPLAERAWVVPREVEGEKFAPLLGDVAGGLAERLTLPPPDPIILRATGDIIPARCAYERQLAYGDLGHAFRELGPWLAEADITVGSLDAAISDAGVPFGCVETFSLLAPAASADGLAYAGFDVITVATNHVKDCGQSACGDQAFFDTLANLRARGIAPVGGGADLAEARKPAVLTAKGVRFAFLGYDEIASYYHAAPSVAGTAPLDEAFVREDVASARQQADVVVVLPQWGVEYTADPTLGQRALAAAAVESGADLVIGNHPHWVQAAELIPARSAGGGGAFVAYALGNFVFDQDWSVETQQGVVLEAAFHGRQLKGVRYHPIRIVDEHQPVFADPGEAQQILDRIWAASAALP